MKLIFVDELPSNSEGRYIHFHNRKVSDSGWEAVDLKSFMKENIVSWQDQLDDWYGEMSRVGQGMYSDWWLTDASRVISWFPSVNQALFFAVGLVRYCEKNDLSEVFIVNAPEFISDFIKDMRPHWTLEGRRESKSLSVVRRIKNSLSPVKVGVQGLIRSFQGVGNRAFSPDKVKAVIYSHLIDYEFFQRSGDHFFGEMFNKITSIDDEDLCWIFMSDVGNINNEKNFIENLRKRYPKSYVVQDLLRLSEAFKILLGVFVYKIFSLRFKSKIPTIEIDGLSVESFSRHFYSATISNRPPSKAQMLKYVFSRVAARCEGIPLFYPFEDKGIERAILENVKGKLPTYSFAHAVHNYGHLYLRKKKQGEIAPPWPDYIGCTGEGALKWLEEKKGIPKEDLVLMGSKRYKEVIEKKEFNNKNLNILVLISQGYEVGEFANYVEEDPAMFSDCEIVIRKYPFAFHEEQDAGIERIKKFPLNIKVEGGDLVQQIERADLVIFGSTSAGVESMLCGRLSVSLDIHHIVNLNCVTGKGNLEDIYVADNCEELRNIINEVKAMSIDEYKSKAEGMRRFGLGIYNPVNHSVIEGILKRYSSSD